MNSSDMLPLFELAKSLRAFYPASMSAKVSLLESSAFFDSDYYLSRNDDVRFAGMDAVSHFLEYGFREGRIPSPKWEKLLQSQDWMNICISSLGNFTDYIEALANFCAKKYPNIEKNNFHGSSLADTRSIDVHWNILAISPITDKAAGRFESIVYLPSESLFMKAITNLLNLNRKSYSFNIYGSSEAFIGAQADTIKMLTAMALIFRNRCSALNLIFSPPTTPTLAFLNTCLETLLDNVISFTLSIDINEGNLGQIYRIITDLSVNADIHVNLFYNPGNPDKFNEINADLALLKDEYKFSLQLFMPTHLRQNLAPAIDFARPTFKNSSDPSTCIQCRGLYCLSSLQRLYISLNGDIYRYPCAREEACENIYRDALKPGVIAHYKECDFPHCFASENFDCKQFYTKDQVDAYIIDSVSANI